MASPLVPPSATAAAALAREARGNGPGSLDGIDPAAEFAESISAPFSGRQA